MLTFARMARNLWACFDLCGSPLADAAKDTISRGHGSAMSKTKYPY